MVISNESSLVVVGCSGEDAGDIPGAEDCWSCSNGFGGRPHFHPAIVAAQAAAYEASESARSDRRRG